jgi:uncharacterized OB-fold protein
VKGKMSFGRFGKISYVAETKLQDWMRFLEEGKIMASKCKKCHRIYFPPRAECDCMMGEPEWVELKGNCKLVTFTIVHFAPASFKGDIPYALGVAQFQEGPTVFAPLSKDIRFEEIEIGMVLKLVPLKLEDSKIIYELRKL